MHNYQCESGETILATYRSTDSARVQIAVSGSGARYVGGGLEWWTKGSGAESEGTLFRHMPVWEYRNNTDPLAPT